MKKLIIPFLILIGCSEQITDYKVDPMVQPSLDKFYETSLSFGKSFSHSNLEITMVSQLRYSCSCFAITTLRSNGGQRQIQFDYDFWISNPDKVDALTLHEFGHAFLGRKHNSSENSVMNPSTVWNGMSKHIDRDVYINELFANENK